jgi:hypothetical protein
LEISWILDVGDKHDLFMLQLHLIKAEASVSHFAHFTTAHLCPLGPRVRMNCSKLSALTTRGRFHGVSLDLLLFLELVYQGPQHHILHMDLDLGGVTFDGGGVSKPPPPMGVVASPPMVEGFIC